MRVFRKLKLWQKLGILLVFVSIPLMGTSSRLLTARFAEMESFGAQKDGIQYLLSIRQLVQLTAEHRGITFAYLKGDDSFRSRIDSKRQEIDNELDTLAMLKTDHGPRLGSIQSWGNINRSWRTLKSRSKDAEVNFELHSEMVHDLLSLNADVADSTGLLLGSDLAIFYFSDIVAFKSPALAESLGVLRGRASGAVASGQLTDTNRGQLASLMAQAKMHQRQLDRSIAVLGGQGVLSPGFTAAHEDQAKSILSFFGLIESALAGKGMVDAVQMFASGSDAISETYALYDLSIGGLDSRIQASVDALNDRLTLGYSQLTVIAILFLGGFWILLKSIISPLQHAVQSSRAIAEGKLGFQISDDGEGNDEIAELLRTSRQMRDRLFNVVSEIRTASDTVVQAANQVKDGNIALSTQSQEQASSVGEISSSVQQMTQFVNDNASIAQDAVQMSDASEKQANHGSQVVAKAVDAMDRVSASSQQVQEIVAVIDDIAFQTNLLALNAATEAARAGESGRGFAVVAGEIRSLSGRSTLAAKEIKELIDDTLNRISAGHQYVNETGEVFEGIAGEVSNLSEMVRKIAAASREQADRLQQINASIGTIDSMTQQNAALVEEAAASAETMEAQAEHLLSMIEFFDTGEGNRESDNRPSRVNSDNLLKQQPQSRALRLVG